MSEGVVIYGPFSESRVTLNGFDVPFITAHEHGDSVAISVDRRFGMPPVSREEFERWIPMLANAMAVAAGYSSHGENCRALNPFMVRIGQIGVPPNLRLVDKPEVDKP